MKPHQLLARDEFRFGTRGLLQPGDRFRVRGGPVYTTADGRKLAMYERGVFVFRRHCIRGSAQWLEAYRDQGSGMVILWVGKSIRSPICPNLRRRPYRITAKLARRSRG